MISGSYLTLKLSNPGGRFAPMHIFYGAADGTFSKPKVMRGTDGKPLIMQTKDDATAKPKQRTKSSPFPVDLNGDGLLDLVSGNAAGTFAFFPATEKGKFAPEPTWLRGPDGKKLITQAGDSGPSFIDWDNDGDMDFLTGSGGSGVFLFKNIGTKKQPKFAAMTTLIPNNHSAPKEEASEDDDQMPPRLLGYKHIKAPNVSWRVTVADFNQDGKLDLIVGDRQFINLKNKDVSEKEAAEKLAKWQVKYDALHNDGDSLDDLDFDNEDKWTPAEKKAWDEYVKASDKLDAEFEKFAKEREFGFVWLYLQK